MDPITATVIGTGAKVAGGISTALSTLKTARELAKDSKDSDLKDKISDAYDALLDLREALQNLQTENEMLRQQVKQRASISRTSEFGYYYIVGDPDPLCPKCYEANDKIIHLNRPSTWETGAVSRSCEVCGYMNFERSNSRVQQQQRFNRGHDPYS